MDYNIIDELGRGARGVVHLVEKDGRKFALKTLHRETGAEALDSVVRFRQESLVLSRLSHPGIVAVHEVGEDEGWPFIVMEYLEGESLSARMRRAPLGVELAVDIARQIASALSEIHRLKFVHRDLKPDNVLIDAKNIVKIIDFGMVAEIGASELGDGAAIGTPEYAAPEQLGILKAPIEEAADLYSLGVILVEMLTGKTPFTSAVPGKALQLKSEFKPETLAANEKIPPVLGEIIAKLISFGPRQRYQTARGLLKDLEGLAALEEAHRNKAPYVLAKADQALRIVEGPLVGRKPEMDLIESAWTNAISQRGSAMLLEGAPGLGKSRLAHEAARLARSKSLEAKCSRIDALALAPVLDLLKTYFGRVLALPLAQREARLAELRGFPANVLSAVALVSKEFADALGWSRAPYRGGQESYYQYLIQIFVQIAKAQGGLLIVIEDIQWLDENSAQFVKRLCREIDRTPILLILTARSDGETAALIELKSIAASLHLNHRPLTALVSSDMSPLIAGFLGLEEVPKMMAATIAKAAGNNPFGLRELLRTLLDQSVLTFEAGQLLFDEAKFRDVDISKDAARVIEDRIKTLSPSSRQILISAAVLGDRFEIENLVRVLKISESAVQAVIESARDDGFVDPYAKGVYAFAHQRIRDTLLSLPGDEGRRELYMDAAKAYEDIPSKSMEQADALATFYLRGNPSQDTGKALRAWLDVGRTAMSAYSYRRAYEVLHAAVQLLDPAQDTNAINGECIELYAFACLNTGKFEEALQVFDRRLRRADDRIVRGRCYHGKVKASLGRGKADEGWASFLAGMRAMGKPFPENKFVKGLAFAGYLVISIVLTYMPWGFRRRGQVHHLAEEARVLSKMMEEGTNVAFLRSKPLDFLQLCMRSNLYTLKAGPCPELAMAVTLSASAFANIGLKSLVERKFKFARGIAKELGDESLDGLISLYYAISLIFLGDYKRYDEHFEQVSGRIEKLLPYWPLASLYMAHTSALAQRGFFRELINFQYQKLPLIDETKNLAFMADFRLTYASRLEILGRSEEAHKIREEAGKLSIGRARNFSGNTFEDGVLILEAYELNNLFSERLEKAIHEWIERRDRSIFLIGVLIYICQLRVEQYEVAPQERKPYFLEQLNAAIKLLKARSRNTLFRAMLHVSMAAQARIRRQYDKADLYLDRADEVCLKMPAPIGIFAVMVERAYLARDRGQVMQVELHARAALNLAQSSGWVHRASRVAATFGLSVESVVEAKLESTDTKGLGIERAMSALLAISAAASRHIDPIAQGRSTLDAVVRLMGSERACIFLGEESSSLRFFLGRTTASEDIVEMKGFSTTVVRKVFEERRPLIITGTDQGEAIGSQSIVAHNLKSIMVVPLLVQEDIKGVIYLDSSLAKGLFSDADLDLLVAISTQIASTIQIAEMAVAEADSQSMKKDLELSASVQKMFLPEISSLESSGARLAGFYRPAAQCGGDWWWYKADPTKISVVVGDVTGHGAAPAMITASVASSFRALEKQGNVGIPAMIESAHNQLLEIAKREYAMTMFGVELDVKNKGARFWSACAPSAIVLNKVDGASGHWHAQGGLLGMDSFFLEEGKVDVREGDRIFIYSDGLLEMKMTDGREVGERRLLNLLKKSKDQPVEEARLSIVEELDKWRGPYPQEDDFTFVLIDI